MPTSPRVLPVVAAVCACTVLSAAAPAAAASLPDLATAATAALQVGPGATGPAVVVLQDTLNDWGQQIPVDGQYTAATASAVARAIQQVGVTAADLLTQLALLGFGPRAIALGPGDQGAAVATLQHALTRAGFGVEATGVFGPQTEDEVKAFQQSVGLAATGEITIWQVEEAAAPATAPAADTGSAAQGQTAPALSGQRSAVVQLAAALNGRAYAWGGSGPYAFDCSGLTRYVLGAAAGVWLPHSSYLQWFWGRAVPSGYLQPGDLVFFNTDGPGPSHVGIYIGGSGEDFVDATDPAGGVQIDSLYNAYWGSHYVGGRSLLS